MLYKILYQLLVEEQEITSTELSQLEKYLDKFFKNFQIDIEFTKHFKERMVDDRNNKPITFSELKLIFEKIYQKHAENISKHQDKFEAIIKDLNTQINIPFVLEWNKSTNLFELVSKTIMRKKDFKSNDKAYFV